MYYVCMYASKGIKNTRKIKLTTTAPFEKLKLPVIIIIKENEKENVMNAFLCKNEKRKKKRQIRVGQMKELMKTRCCT